jgi:triosephosphate isomerase
MEQHYKTNTKKCIIANWKSNGSIGLVDNLADALRSNGALRNRLISEPISSSKVEGAYRLKSRGNQESNERLAHSFIFCPPAPLLAYAAGKFPGISVGAQDCAIDGRTCTGDVPCALLKEIGVTHVIIGHSERRQMYQEADEIVAQKIKTALQHGIIPIVCIGESLSEHSAGETANVLKHQLQAVRLALSIHTFPDVQPQSIQTALDVRIQSTKTSQDAQPPIIIAYEPIWAVGAAIASSLEDIHSAHYIINDITGLNAVYGGAVSQGNYNDILTLDNVSGVLVGRASLDVSNFAKWFYHEDAT